MKSYTLDWTHDTTARKSNGSLPVSGLNKVLSLAVKLFVASVPALAIVVGATWAIAAPDTAIIMQALMWASGFIFLTLALESSGGKNFGWTLSTGLLLPVLALMSSRVAEEFLVIAAALVAGWVAHYLFNRG